MTVTPWKKRNESAYTAGHRRMLKREFELPDGTVTDFDVMDSGRVVCILALTKDRHVILAKQFRAGPGQVLLELPGGGIEKGESPRDAAARELLEETGYRGNVTFVSESLHSGYDTMVRYNFVATDCEHVQDISNDEHEFTEAVEMPLDGFREHVRSGQLTDMGTAYRGLDFLGLLS